MAPRSVVRWHSVPAAKAASFVVACFRWLSPNVSVAICPVQHNRSCVWTGIVAKSRLSEFSQAVATAVRHVGEQDLLRALRIARLALSLRSYVKRSSACSVIVSLWRRELLEQKISHDENEIADAFMPSPAYVAPRGATAGCKGSGTFAFLGLYTFASRSVANADARDQSRA